MTMASSTAPGVPTTVESIPCPRSKRTLNVMLSGAGLLLTLPLGVVFAAAIKLGDGGPIFFMQPRIGAGPANTQTPPVGA